MRQCCMIEVQTLRRFGLEADTIVAYVKQSGDVPANLSAVRADLGSSQNEARVEVADLVSGIAHSFQCLLQKDYRVRAFPFGIRWREQGPDIRGGNRSEQGIGDGVQQHIAIGMSA